MRQVVPKNISKKHKVKKERKCVIKKPKYGTSKLEHDFARDFLDKYGLKYIYQYEAKDIKRFFDFAITCYNDVDYKTEVKDGIECVKQDGQLFPIDMIIEIDGSFFHADPRVVNEDKLTPMHKHNKFVDKLKDNWAAMRCIPLVRIWEYDIRNNPKKVIEELSKYVNISKKNRKKKENFKKPH